MQISWDEVLYNVNKPRLGFIITVRIKTSVFNKKFRYNNCYLVPKQHVNLQQHILCIQKCYCPAELERMMIYENKFIGLSLLRYKFLITNINLKNVHFRLPRTLNRQLGSYTGLWHQNRLYKSKMNQMQFVRSLYVKPFKTSYLHHTGRGQ